MDNLDKTFTEEILQTLKNILGRDLTAIEVAVFTQKRSLLAYEMILDYISDDFKAKQDIEEYVNKVVGEKLN